jgi:hypothetical protein
MQMTVASFNGAFLTPALVIATMLSSCGDAATESENADARTVRTCLHDAGASIAQSSDELEPFAGDALDGRASDPKLVFTPDYEVRVWRPDEKSGRDSQPRYELYVGQANENRASVREIADGKVDDAFVAYVRSFDRRTVERTNRCLDDLART